MACCGLCKIETSTAYRETLEYFAEQTNSSLRPWVITMEEQRLDSRVEVVHPPLGRAMVKISQSCKERFPVGMRSEVYRQENRLTHIRLLEALESYGYSKDELIEMAATQGIAERILGRKEANKSLRVGDALELLRAIRLMEQGETSAVSKDVELEQAAAEWDAGPGNTCTVRRRALQRESCETRTTRTFPAIPF